MAITKTKQKTENKCWQQWGDTGIPMIASGDIKWCNHCGRLWWFLKELNKESPYIITSNSTSGHILKRIQEGSQRDIGALMFIALFTIAKRCEETH